MARDIPYPSTATTTPAASSDSTFRLSGLEREALKGRLEKWRADEYATGFYAMLPREWLLSERDLKRIIDKANIILNATIIDRSLLELEVASSIVLSPCLDSLCQCLEDFRMAKWIRERRD
ncbi:hypothetical protein AMATHDRAFT_49880 [Amanita thiersii Skay4041]|uniref:Uncharacterized protein n=1 Tax=Amanita thiersii Skay4041 TaxID=703135 RepID=A0A2A9NJT9_9AGAR|nr:hypothetical protein AMATHDRAFT_49880 [Amanita thiersii Skay4041]